MVVLALAEFLEEAQVAVLLVVLLEVLEVAN